MREYLTFHLKRRELILAHVFTKFSLFWESTAVHIMVRNREKGELRKKPDIAHKDTLLVPSFSCETPLSVFYYLPVIL